MNKILLVSLLLADFCFLFAAGGLAFPGFSQNTTQGEESTEIERFEYASKNTLLGSYYFKKSIKKYGDKETDIIIEDVLAAARVTQFYDTDTISQINRTLTENINAANKTDPNSMAGAIVSAVGEQFEKGVGGNYPYYMKTATELGRNFANELIDYLP